MAAEQDGERDDKGGDDSQELKLDWRDYVAIAVAMLQTVLLPIVIVLVVFVVLILILRF